MQNATADCSASLRNDNKVTSNGRSSAFLRNDSKGTSNDKSNDKHGGLSTARRTVRLSVASVEMTLFWKKNKGC
ncbi:hypothetical protein HDF13_003435 [Edaphobacter lichenicola]|uniref:Uncharacterized protein n=1 Tax=Tunturiibacter gelidiferens TaxID=3069689 RepID=A0ACC5P2P4_9BACT|nr:hypothetical protein [Edaphobacter lichenicola]